jgi:two-component system NtrC family sensor kinase
VTRVRPSPERLLDFREYPVLYVDDEVENLRIFELTFQREFSILTATSGEEGLRIINRNPVAVVLSDHRMPGMTGVDFLARVCDLDPKTVRILVTAYGDAKTLQNAINSGSIYRFVPKPWTPEDMRVTLRRAIEVYALDRERGQLLRELTLLNRLSQSINQELELKPLLELLLTTVTEDLGYDGAGILFFDNRGEVLSWGRFAPNGDGASEALRDLKVTKREAPSFVEQLRDGEAQILGMEHALGMEGPIADWVTEVAADQILVVPLMGKGGVIGALAVDNRRGGAKFTSDDQTLLEGLSTQAVIAIENARLVEDLRRSREQIRRADRLGTLGALAAGLAHEINNPLVSIHTFLSMAPDKRHEDDDEFWTDYHALASREVDRIRRLVDTMRRLGRDDGSGQAERESFEPGELLQEVVTLLQREAGRAQVVMRLEREPDTPKIVAVKDHIHQVFMNLLLNAIHASPPEGEVSVRVFPDPAEEAVCIEVTDSGPGIPEEHIDRIFDPFFTTKGPDQGTGLGLMICHRLVADHEGSIEVSSRKGQGATFCARLPLGSDLGSGAQPPVA